MLILCFKIGVRKYSVDGRFAETGCKLHDHKVAVAWSYLLVLSTGNGRYSALERRHFGAQIKPDGWHVLGTAGWVQMLCWENQGPQGRHGWLRPHDRQSNLVYKVCISRIPVSPKLNWCRVLLGVYRSQSDPNVEACIVCATKPIGQ